MTSTQPFSQSPAFAVSSPTEYSTLPANATRTTVVTPSQVTVKQRPIGIRRLPSSNLRQGYDADANGGVSRSGSARGRSTSAPQHLSPNDPNTSNLTRQNTRQSLLPTVTEDVASHPATDRETMNETGGRVPSRRQSIGNTARSVLSRFSDHSREREESEYDTQVVDLLDVLGRSHAPSGMLLC